MKRDKEITRVIFRKKYWKDTKEFLTKHGIEDLFDVPFFPDK